MAKVNMTLEEKLEEAIVKDGPYEVPENWVWTYMGNIGDYINGKAFKPTDWCTEGLPIIRIQNLTGTNEQYNYFNAEIEDKYKIKNGELLMAWSATLDAFIWNNGNAVLNQHIFKVDSKINKKYHYYLLKNTIEEMYAKTHGTGMVHITKGKFEKLEIPIPPLKEQKRIVDRIDSLFEKVDKAKELVEEVREGFEERKAAILEKAFRGELTEKWREENVVSTQWNKYKFKDFILGIQAGKNFKCTERPAAINEVGLVKISAVTWGEFDPFENKVVEDNDKINQKYFINEGDYLISRANTLELVGSSVIVKYIDQTLMLSDKVWRVEFNNEIVSKELINYYVKSIEGRKGIESRATGNQLSMRNISQDSFKDIDIMLPDIKEQREIVRILDKLFEEQSKIKELTQLEEQIELIKKSILAKAFRGELGTNCEEDESALELLKEILSEN